VGEEQLVQLALDVGGKVPRRPPPPHLVVDLAPHLVEVPPGVVVGNVRRVSAGRTGIVVQHVASSRTAILGPGVPAET
jgi:hypothetical protein